MGRAPACARTIALNAGNMIIAARVFSAGRTRLKKSRAMSGIFGYARAEVKQTRALRVADGEILESRELADERKLDDAGRTVALLADDQFRDALHVRRRLALVGVLIFAVDEDDHVGVLLERARLAQV